MKTHNVRFLVGLGPTLEIFMGGDNEILKEQQPDSTWSARQTSDSSDTVKTAILNNKSNF